MEPLPHNRRSTVLMEKHGKHLADTLAAIMFAMVAAIIFAAENFRK